MDYANVIRGKMQIAEDAAGLFVSVGAVGGRIERNYYGEFESVIGLTDELSNCWDGDYIEVGGKTLASLKNCVVGEIMHDERLFKAAFPELFQGPQKPIAYDPSDVYVYE